MSGIVDEENPHEENLERQGGDRQRGVREVGADRLQGGGSSSSGCIAGQRGGGDLLNRAGVDCSAGKGNGLLRSRRTQGDKYRRPLFTDLHVPSIPSSNISAPFSGTVFAKFDLKLAVVHRILRLQTRL
jgi:hypothetical protein